MRTADSTPFTTRERPRRRVRVVPPLARRALLRSAGHHPTATSVPKGSDGAPAPASHARSAEGRAHHRGAVTRPTPDDATLRALFRVAAAAVARRGEPGP
jgi:hypothetical protein